MKTCALLLGGLSLLCNAWPAIAQIDTTRRAFFPLHIGDLWQYRDLNNQLAIQEVVGDTMIDGQRYFLLVHSLRTSGGGITRIDSLIRVQNRRGLPTGGDSCGGESPYELSIYRLAEPESSAWNICEQFWGLPSPNPLARFNGVSIQTVFGQPREVMRFDFGGTVEGAPFDTLFGFGALLARGIGILHEQYYDGWYYVLHGCIIDGIQYGTIVSVEGRPETRPQQTALLQNYPNPFNPSTSIRYQIPARVHVELTIYNVLGQRVALLADEIQEAGVYEVTFHAHQLASGVYFYRLVAGEYSWNRKMILQK